MKKLYNFFISIFSRADTAQSGNKRNIFDYSSKERIKMMRAAGREAQREQARLLQKYEARYVRA